MPTKKDHKLACSNQLVQNDELVKLGSVRHMTFLIKFLVKI
jgi:hypothetical protein